MADDAGPLLARAGLIEQDHLIAARRAQAERGGTLGEHLVLLGAISDDDLTAFYRTRLMVPRVDPMQLENIPARVIKRIPKDMAVEFRVIPVTIDREQNLVLAMSDPSNTHAVDEIAFFTGAYVVRAVATQREIADSLIRYYDATTPLATERDPRTPVERRKVKPPLTSPPAPGQAAVRLSALVPALRDAHAGAHGGGGSATAGAKAPTYVDRGPAHARRTLREVALPPEDFEGDTRPIVRAIDAVPGRRRSDEPPRVASGEVESHTPHHPPHRASEPAVIIDIPEPESADGEQPILLDRPLRPSGPPPPEDEVVLLDAPLRRRRRSSATQDGLGKVGSGTVPRQSPDADNSVERPGEHPPPEQTGPTQPRKTVLGTGIPEPIEDGPATGRYARSDSPPAADDDGFGKPGTTIPPPFIGAIDDELSGPTDVGAAPPLASASYAASLERATTTMAELENARTRDEVIALLVAHLTHDCRRVAFFAVSKGTVRVWSASGDGIDCDASLALDRPSTFQDIVATRMPFHGPLHDDVSREFLRAAVGSTPSDVTMLPVVVRDKVAGLLYGADRFDTVHDDHLLLLARSSGAALERILVAQKSG